MSDNSVLCYCFDVKREDVLAHFSKPGAQLDEFVEKTRVATKCTACALDLHALLDEIHSSAGMKKARTAALVAASRGWQEKIDRIDSGFFICDGVIKSQIRLANRVPPPQDQAKSVAHRYRLTLFDNDGHMRARLLGHVGADEEITIDLITVKDCPAQGWFLLLLQPEGPGFYGTLRPQVTLQGPNWVTCYHTQYHTDAAKFGRRSGAPLRTSGGRTRVQVSIINGQPKACSYTATILSRDGIRESSASLPANGACIFDIDTAFPDLPENQTVLLRIRSEQPTRKNIIYRHPDGCVGVDHFPNLV